MTSVRGVDPYHYLVQTIGPPPKPIKGAPLPLTVSGLLSGAEEMRIFNHLVKMADLVDRFGGDQFNGTLFVVKDY